MEASCKESQESSVETVSQCNKKAKDRTLECGDKVLLLLPSGNNRLEIG